MPWTLPGDLAHFRAFTMGKPLLMGRRTYDSIGRPLPGRPTIVLSRDRDFAPEGVTVARDLETAWRLASHLGRTIGASDVIVAGGAAVYHAALPSARSLLITEVDVTPEGDTHFPLFASADWLQVERVDPPPAKGDSAPYAFVRYQRRPQGRGDLPA